MVKHSKEMRNLRFPGLRLLKAVGGDLSAGYPILDSLSKSQPELQQVNQQDPSDQVRWYI